mmetsp:Transcript_19734/g.21949  ORF Transcript_19734/g.21949 Transcript_19734/m.21949 type:complete len:101 (+) Transcript_19734:88-390(+)
MSRFQTTVLSLLLATSISTAFLLFYYIKYNVFPSKATDAYFIIEEEKMNVNIIERNLIYLIGTGIVLSLLSMIAMKPSDHFRKKALIREMERKLALLRAS